MSAPFENTAVKIQASQRVENIPGMFRTIKQMADEVVVLMDQYVATVGADPADIVLHAAMDYLYDDPDERAAFIDMRDDCFALAANWHTNHADVLAITEPPPPAP